MTENVNDTIMKMVKNLKTTVQTEKNNYSFSPLKRSISSSNSNESSYDDPTPVKKIKQESKLDLSYIGSPREMRRLRADLVEARNTILSLESRISHIHGLRKQGFDEKKQSLKRQREYEMKSIEELVNQLQNIGKREADIKNNLAEFQVNNKYDLLKIRTSEEVQKLEKSLEEYKEESRQIESEENSIIPGLERKISELETMLEAAEEYAEAQKKLATELEKQLSEKNSVERDLEQKEQALQKAKLYIKELEYAKENILEFQEQAKTQAHKLANYVEMQKENEQLREENARIKEDIRNKLLLEEEVYDLKSRLSKFKAQEKKLADLQEAKVAKAELEKNQKLLIELKTTGEQKQSLIHRMQKRLLLVSRERDSYRLQLDSYEKDLTMCENTTNTGGSGSNQLQAQKERVENLERIVEGYRDMVNKLENDLQNAQPNTLSERIVK